MEQLPGVRPPACGRVPTNRGATAVAALLPARDHRAGSPPERGEELKVGLASAVVSRSFAPDAASVPMARRFVRGVLVERGREEWLDEAQLAVSELTTNAMIHAHSPFEVIVQVLDHGVYIQVWDDEPVLPARRRSDEDSTTGRGLELVQAVASCFGFQVVGPTKVVWVCLGMSLPESAQLSMLDRWRHRADVAVPESLAPSHTVLLRRVPVSLWLSARVHHNDLMREYALHQSTDVHSLDRLVSADRARSLVLAAVRALGDTTTADLVLQVRADQVHWFEALRDVIDDAERLASSGDLLAPPGPPLILDVRHWACAQVLGQLEGREAEAWGGPLSLPPG